MTHRPYALQQLPPHRTQRTEPEITFNNSPLDYHKPGPREFTAAQLEWIIARLNDAYAYGVRDAQHTMQQALGLVE